LHSSIYDQPTSRITVWVLRLYLNAIPPHLQTTIQQLKVLDSGDSSFSDRQAALQVGLWVIPEVVILVGVL
jgi:hypothetical protein